MKESIDIQYLFRLKDNRWQLYILCFVVPLPQSVVRLTVETHRVASHGAIKSF